MDGGKEELKIYNVCIINIFGSFMRVFLFVLFVLFVVCFILNLEWNPEQCSDYSEDSETAPAIASGRAEYVAFGTFSLIADEGIDNFNQYFINKLSNNSDNENDNDNFINILTDTFNLFDIGYQFEAISVSISDKIGTYIEPKTDEYKKTAINIQYGLYVFMGLCVLLAILGSIHGYITGADNIRVIGIIYFGLWTWDFGSDVLFAARAGDQGFYGLSIISFIFIIIPWSLNMRQLFMNEQKWSIDPTIKDRVTYWMVHYNNMLIVLTAISGSCFSAIEFVNSRIFSHDFFNMGLTERHLKSFNSTRLYSNIIFEVKFYDIIYFYVVTLKPLGLHFEI